MCHSALSKFVYFAYFWVYYGGPRWGFAGCGIRPLRDSGLVTKFREIRDSNWANAIWDAGYDHKIAAGCANWLDFLARYGIHTPPLGAPLHDNVIKRWTFKPENQKDYVCQSMMIPRSLSNNIIHKDISNITYSNCY